MDYKKFTESMSSFEIKDLLGWIGCLGLPVLASSLLYFNYKRENRRDAIFEEILEQLKRTNNLTDIVTKNVIGGSEPEKFYQIKGQRVYLEVDGKPVEEYWRGK